MKLNLFLVTYENGKRIEERWEDISRERKKKLSKELSDSSMKVAGFMPAKVPE